VRCHDGDVGEHLIGHPEVAAIVLTGAYETAELFTRVAPGTPLFAETSGKNSMVIMPDADLDLAVADLVRSAFGHAGQKCSAASLAILVGSVATSQRLRRQLIDATTSLVVGPSTDAASIVGPLIEPAGGKLARALTHPDNGQHWLLEPRRLDADGRLWTPGILEGVRAGSWFHVTECFGPVLGLMTAADLDEALRLQNAVPFGLTGGIHSLDDDVVATWLERVEVGNAYVNRGITGAIVRRQPFGGWKRSSVGPAAKAGGPNYVNELGRWSDGGIPMIGAEPDGHIAALAARLRAALAPAERRALDAAVRSDAHWWADEFAVDRDPSGLFCEANVFRYRPLPDLVVRVAADAAELDVARVLCAVQRSGSPVTVSVHQDYAGPLGEVDHVRASAGEFAATVTGRPPARIRALGSVPVPEALPAAPNVDRRAVVLNGRIELARYLREQAVSRTLHRFGNIVGRGRGDGVTVGMEPPRGG
jgi:RHH-type proline utilization regulon transcriptional repressor/proline dehydrogenase/delta 1-pyrroline-5-carboxylate dehydrogenase